MRRLDRGAVTEYGRTVTVSTPVLTPIATSRLTLETRPTIRAGSNVTTTVSKMGSFTVKQRIRSRQKGSRRFKAFYAPLLAR
ncbi:hypothetical protein GCM10007979_46750 [Nocardioides albus]|nr:hypothetical protein GCM10007979_46750 [Nocardioides albus]